jgi:hypothetical protein
MLCVRVRLMFLLVLNVLVPVPEMVRLGRIRGWSRGLFVLFKAQVYAVGDEDEDGDGDEVRSAAYLLFLFETYQHYPVSFINRNTTRDNCLSVDLSPS